MRFVRFLAAFLGALALLTITGGVLAIATDFPAGGRGPGSLPSVEPTSASVASSAPTAFPTPSGSSGTAADSATLVESQVTPEGNGGFVAPDIQLKQPHLELPTGPLFMVEGTYTEGHTFGNVDVRFRPGAFSPEHAAEIAQLTVEALAEANQKLGTNWNEQVTILLAEQLFAEDCLGCQGFTESDFRWIFLLDDGSVVTDELEALLVHEVTHLIAGNEIHLPLEIFYVEGLAMWVMSEDIVNADYISPLQSTVWAYEAGVLPALQTLTEDDFAGRMRKRLYYDASGAFAAFIIERYGWESFLRLYRQDSLDAVLGKPIEQVEGEWHAYLDQFTGETVNGVGGAEWWAAAQAVIDGFVRFYESPDAVTSDQYRQLTLARLALNRAHVDDALRYLQESGV
jgi:hypothetical protein